MKLCGESRNSKRDIKLQDSAKIRVNMCWIKHETLSSKIHQDQDPTFCIQVAAELAAELIGVRHAA